MTRPQRLLGSLSGIRSHKGVFVLTPHLHNFFSVLSPSRLSADLLLHLISKNSWNIFECLSIKCLILRAQHCVDRIFIGIFIFTRPNRSRNRIMPLGDWNDIEDLHKSVLTGVQILNFKDLSVKRFKVISLSEDSPWFETGSCSIHFDQWLLNVLSWIALIFFSQVDLQLYRSYFSALVTAECNFNCRLSRSNNFNICSLDDCLISKQIDRDS